MIVPKKLYKIGELIQYTGLSRQVIHNYTLLELIREAKRTPSGHRLYDEEAFRRISRVKELKAKGKTLSEIKKIINNR